MNILVQHFLSARTSHGVSTRRSYRLSVALARVGCTCREYHALTRDVARQVRDATVMLMGAAKVGDPIVAMRALAAGADADVLLKDKTQGVFRDEKWMPVFDALLTRGVPDDEKARSLIGTAPWDVLLAAGRRAVDGAYRHHPSTLFAEVLATKWIAPEEESVRVEVWRMLLSGTDPPKKLLWYAARAGASGPCLTYLVSELGLDPNSPESCVDDDIVPGSSPLWVALAFGRPETALWLLDAGADPNFAGTVPSYSNLSQAIRQARYHFKDYIVVDKLLELGVNLRPTPHVPDAEPLDLLLEDVRTTWQPRTWQVIRTLFDSGAYDDRISSTIPAIEGILRREHTNHHPAGWDMLKHLQSKLTS